MGKTELEGYFSRVHKAERVGSGIKRMKESMTEANLPWPQFETSVENSFFTIVFKRPVEKAKENIIEENTRNYPRNYPRNFTVNKRKTNDNQKRIGSKNRFKRGRHKISFNQAA